MVGAGRWTLDPKLAKVAELSIALTWGLVKIPASAAGCTGAGRARTA